MASGSERLRPATAWLTLNRACNLRCAYCYAAGAAASSAMSAGTLRALVALVADLGVERVVFTGGEPSLSPLLGEGIALCRAAGIACSFPTNGLLYADADEARRLSDSGVGAVTVSLKGWDERSYARVSGVDGFGRALVAIGNLTDVGITCTASIALGAGGLPFLAGMMRRVLGVAGSIGVVVSPLFDCACEGGASFSAAETARFASEFERYYDAIDDASEGNFLLEGTLPLCLLDRSLLGRMVSRNQVVSCCQLLRGDGLVFDVDGRLLPCNALYPYPLGEFGADFSTAEELRAYLSGDAVLCAWEAYRALPSERCAACPESEMCGGGCVMRWAGKSYEDYQPFLRW